MAFPATLTTFPVVTDGVTTLGNAQHSLYKHSLEQLELMHVGLPSVNVIGQGADPTGAANSAAAFVLAIDALGTLGGTVVVPPGDYRMDALVKVPSRVRIQGAGMYATRFFQPAANVDTFLFEVDETAANPGVNIYGQVYGVIFEDFEIRDRASADTYLTMTGHSEDHHGILVHNSDWGQIRNVSIRDLNGRGIHFSDVAREWVCTNVYTQNVGDPAESCPSLDIGSVAGDATNTLYFLNCRFVFPTWRAVVINGAQDGIRLIVFTDCQIEGGGAGSGGALITPHPYDLVWLGRLSDVVFNGCEWSNPGAGKWCINIDGYSAGVPFRIDIDTGRFNGNASGGGIRFNLGSGLAVSQTWWQGSTAGQADYYIETTAGAIYADLANVHSANPTAGSPAGHFRGRVTDHEYNLGDNRLNMPGGGVTSHVAGKPTENMGLGAPAPNGIAKVYDITNFLWWEREFRAGVGDMWVVEPGQTAHRQNDVTFTAATENEYLGYTIPAGALTYGSGIEIEMFGFFSGSGVGTATLRIKIGGTTLSADTSVALLNGVQLWRLVLTVRTHATDFTECRGIGHLMINVVSAATTGEGDIATDEIACNSLVGFTNSALDFSTAKALSVTWQHSTSKTTTMWSGQVRYI